MALELHGTTGVSLVQDGVLTDANMPAGNVLQVVSATYATTTATASTSYVDTGLTASITPLSSNSKILVSTTTSFYLYNGGADNGCAFQIVRGATSILSPISNSVYIAGPTASTEQVFNFPLLYLDSPSTTSATTYKIQMKGVNGSTISAQNGGNTSVIVLMEIAG
jgi:hypothetical protein